MFRLPILVAVLQITAIAAAQTGPADLASRRIAAVQYIPADVLTPEDLKRVEVLQPGSILRTEDIAQAIDRLFATGRFTDIVAEAEPSGADGVTVRLVTTPASFIGGVSVTGKVKQPPDRGTLASASRFTLGLPLRESDIDRSTEQLKQLFTANGLYGAEVTPEVTRSDDGQQVFINFRVNPGKRAKYSAPVIQGDTKFSDDSLIGATHWRIALIHWWRKVTDERTRKGIQGILGKYQNKDRLMARVELQKLDYDPERRRVTPSLQINAGPKVRVEAVEAKVSKRVLRRYVPVFQERAVDNDLLVEGARNLRDYFQSKGYFDVDVDFRTRTVSADERVIEYAIARGQRYSLEEVFLKGANYFREEDLRERMFLQAAGHVVMRHGRYSEAFRKKDEENIQNLYKANGFRDVKVTSTVDRDYQGKTATLPLPSTSTRARSGSLTMCS